MATAMETDDDGTSLPHEVLELVAQRLPSLEVLRLGTVCKAWAEQLGSTELKDEIELKWCTIDGAQWSSATMAAWLGRNLARTRRLMVSEWVHLPPDLLLTAAAAAGSPPAPNGLTRLAFESCDAPQLPDLSSCTSLRELELTNCEHISTLPPLDALTALTKLDVANCFALTQLPPLTALTALKRLNIQDARVLRSVPPLDGCARTLCSLSILDASSLEAVPDLVACTALELLDVTSVGHDRLSLSLPDSGLSRLTCLELNGCKGSTIPPLDRLPALEILQLGNCEVAAEQLAALTACTAVSELFAGSCCRPLNGDNGDDAKHLGLQLPPLTALPALAVLTIGKYDLQPERFPSLAGLTGLTSLTVRACCVQLDRLAPISTMTALRKLIISAVHDIAELPSMAALQALRELQVNDCRGLLALPDLSGCGALQTLRLRRCPSLQSLPDLSRCLQLKEVTVRMCGQVIMDDLWAATAWFAELNSLVQRGVKVVIKQDNMVANFAFGYFTMFGA